MSKVSVHLGFTFRVGDLSSNQYGRVDLTVDQIDTELPITQQLEGVSRTANHVCDYFHTQVDKQLDEVLDTKNG
jgi:hypothetical protein